MTVTDYWDAVAQRYLDLFRDEFDDKPFDLAILRSFAAHFQQTRSIVDVGCGPCGALSRILSGYGLTVTGIDISHKCVALAKTEQPDLDFQVMDMAKMSFPDKGFDGLVAYYVLHYTPISDLPGVIREFARVLKPGGRLLLVAKEGDGEGWIDDPMGITDQVFWSAPSLADLQNLLTDNGFTISDCQVRKPHAQEIDVRRIYLTAIRI
ncbi:methyltransferase domain protein [Asticcacaulis biprosthecium C19]|uniref:Methyltransferase domain protein n=1 Tax=Asticcacaulis biprosthecium C19 TaxID=715226 RepID=F4QHU2_9CAUL|nr:class I SAM-dependent methyltransferase [Asticcacaulis biprosthecium]EGF92829.1 methyltransferase domain protein [Asticcacaulis biprosthecium C19]